MRKTKYYQLNQWDAMDRIQRQDFNRDNSTVDDTLHSQETALNAEEQARMAAVEAERKALESTAADLRKEIQRVHSRIGPQAIRTVRAEAPVKHLSLPLDDIVWRDWSAVQIFFHYETEQMPSGSEGWLQFGSSGQAERLAGGFAPGADGQVLLFPGSSAGTEAVHGLLLGPISKLIPTHATADNGGWLMGMTYSQLTELQLKTNGANLGTGAWMSVRGFY